jgi:hypothetical protein
MRKVDEFYCVTVTVCPATVTDPDRGGPVYGTALTRAIAVPVLSAPSTMVSQDVLLEADHVQAGGAVTPTARGFPLGGIWMLVVLTWKVQLVACLTVNVCPAIETVPLLALPGFGATFSLTVSPPVPVSPRLTSIQEVLLTAFHEQPFVAETLTSITPPLTPADSLAALIE